MLQRWSFVGWRGCVRLMAAVVIAAAALTGTPARSMAQGSGPVAVPAARKATNVAIITIKGDIKGKENENTTAISVERRIKLAQRAGADAIVFELDTPGGDVWGVITICGLIKSCPIANTVAWVNTKAYSGGAVIALACREIVTSPASDFGDALPIQVSPISGLMPMPAEERQKIVGPLLAEVVDSARKHGRDEFLVQGLVSLGVKLWLVENTQTHQRLFVNEREYRLIFGEAPPTLLPRVPSAQAGAVSEPSPDAGTPGPASEVTPPTGSPDFAHERVIPAIPGLEGAAAVAYKKHALLLQHASSRPVLSVQDRGQWQLVEFVTDGSNPLTLKADDLVRYGLATDKVKDDEELKAYFGAKNIQRLDESWSEGLVTFLTNIVVRALLIVILLIGLFIEMTHPGVILPGAVAVAALFALVAPPLIIGMAGWWEVAAIIGGLLLILLEIFVIPGFGVVGVAGVLALFAGLVGTFVPRGAGGLFPDTAQGKSDLLYGFTTVMASAVTAMVGMYFIGKNFGSLPMLGRLVLKSPDPSEVDAGGMLSAMEPGLSELRPGMTGTAITTLRPSGRVQFGDRIVDVVAELGWIPSGATVKIVEAGEFRVSVELVAAQGESAAGDGGERA